MLNDKDAISLVITAINDLNKHLSIGKQVNSSVDTILIGSEGALDSLEIITLLVSIEDKATQEIGNRPSLLETIYSDGAPLQSFTVQDIANRLIND